MGYCRKCLTKDMDWNDYFATMHQYIDQIDPEMKVDAMTYQSRLSVCSGCERLLDAMCNACGCYVELRAAMKKKDCPYRK